MIMINEIILFSKVNDLIFIQLHIRSKSNILRDIRFHLLPTSSIEIKKKHI